MSISLHKWEEYYGGVRAVLLALIGLVLLFLVSFVFPKRVPAPSKVPGEVKVEDDLIQIRSIKNWYQDEEVVTVDWVYNKDLNIYQSSKIYICLYARDNLGSLISVKARKDSVCMYETGGVTEGLYLGEASLENGLFEWTASVKTYDLFESRPEKFYFSLLVFDERTEGWRSEWAGLVGSAKSPEFVIVTSTPRELENFDWRVPPLPSGFDWEERTLTLEEAAGGRMYYDDALAPHEYPDFVTFGEIQAPGKIYEARVPDSDPMYDKAGYKLRTELDRIFDDLGWYYRVEYGIFQISGMAADSPLASKSGWVKLNGPVIRTIVYSYDIAAKVKEGTHGIETECPCKKTVSIFISDPVDIRGYLPF